MYVVVDAVVVANAISYVWYINFKLGYLILQYFEK